MTTLYVVVPLYLATSALKEFFRVIGYVKSCVPDYTVSILRTV
jgi:hypothetical protein